MKTSVSHGFRTRALRLGRLAAAAAVLAAPLTAGPLTASAGAAELEARKIRNWTAGAYTDDQTGQFSRCTMSVDYKSGITLLFSIDRKYEWTMALIDPEWKLTVGATHPIRFAIDDLKPFNAQAKVLSRTMVGIPLADNVALFNAFRAGSLLEIRAQSDTFQFRLDGTSDGLAWLLSCVKRYETWVPPVAKTNPFGGTPSQGAASQGTAAAGAAPTGPSTSSAAGVAGSSSAVPGVSTRRKIDPKTFAADGWGIADMVAGRDEASNVTAAPSSSKPIEVPKTTPAAPPAVAKPPLTETAPPSSPPAVTKPPLIEARAPDATAPAATTPAATTPTAASAPSTNAALDAVTGGSIETRVEATVMLANLMASAGISGYRILPPSEAPASLVGAEVVFAADALIGAVRVAPGTDAKAIATGLVAADSQNCTGQYASGVLPAADGRPEVAHVFTGCDQTGTPTASRYTILTRKKGGFFVVSVMPRDGAKADDRLKQVDGSIRDASLKVVGRF